MTLTVVEGFDALTTALVASAYPLGSTFSPDMQPGRFGGQAYRPGPGNQNGFFTLGTGSVSQCAFGAALSFTSAQFAGFGTGVAVVRWLDGGGNRQAALQIASDGTVRAMQGVSTLLGASSAGVWTADAFQYLEVEFVLSDTVGVFKVWLNGVQIINLTNVDTKGQSATTFATLEFTGSGSGQGGFMIDDLYYNDVATRIGECRVETIRPNADTADADWTPNGGTAHFSRVNETVSDGDTTYVSSSTVGHRDLYELGNLSGVPAAIHAVAPVMIARKDDATTRAVALVTDSGGTVTVGGNKAMTASYARYADILELNPDTGSAWDAAAVNALLVGVEVTV
jgi:hypothetical protein